MSVQAIKPQRSSNISPEEWEVRVALGACYRLVHLAGWTDLVFTHISARVPGSEEHFLLNPFGYAFDEVTASNLVRIDLDGNVVDGSNARVHKAGFVIHSAVHGARADAGCVIHTHSIAGMAVSMLKDGLLPLSQHAQLFYNRLGEGTTLHFQPLADADADADGEVTLEELSKVDIKTLIAEPYSYDPSGLPAENLRALVEQLSRTVGHFRGEGECVPQ